MASYLRMFRSRGHLAMWKKGDPEAAKALYDGHDDGTSVYAVASDRDIELVALCLSSRRANAQPLDCAIIPLDAIIKAGFRAEPDPSQDLGLRFADARHHLINIFTSDEAQALLKQLRKTPDAARRFETSQLRNLARGPFRKDEITAEEIARLPTWLKPQEQA